ncbi:MAG: T9SS type A sorting domain-containing protein, partial [Chitinophagales bacterium]
DGGEETIYEWRSDVILPSPNESAVEVNASMLGLYTVSVKTIGGCEELIGFDVILRELPDVNASMDFVEACKGDTVRLQLSGALSYEFVEKNEQPFELSYLSDNEVEIIVSNDLDFSIIGTNGFGCTGIFDVKIDQISEPASVEYGGVICFGDSVELSADGGEGASYSWTPMAAFDNSNISNPIVSPTESVVYTVLITDKNGCESTHTVVVVVGVEVTADLAATPNEMCEPKPTVLSVEGSLFSEYIFYDETGAVVAENNTGQAVVIPPNTSTYTVVVANADGCTAMDEVTVTVQDMSIYLAENFIVCEDEKLTLKPIVNAPDLSYEWTPNTGIDNSNALNPIVSISETTTYTLTTTSDSGCTSSIQTSIEVAEDCVYPGDADDNGKVNMFDLFAIGLHFDKSGFARNTISNKWQGFGCYDWSETQENGKNLKYVDSNGNGTIGFEDTVALVYNFDLHQKSGGFTKGSLGDPELQFVPNFETIGPDETLEFEVWLGSDTNPVSNLYAIAFETFFDTNLIDGNSISMDYTNSSLGTLGESLLATGWINEANGRINVSLSKIDGSGVSGKVYLLSIRMRTQDVFAASNFSFNITDFGATNSNGTEVLVNVDETPSIRIDPNVVGIEENTVLTKPYTLHPSFTQNGFYISYQSHKTPLVEVTLFDLSGQKLDIWSLQRKSNSGVFKTYIDLKEKGLAAGLYLVELKVEGNIYQEKVVFY